jgi:hypothetical protein
LTTPEGVYECLAGKTALDSDKYNQLSFFSILLIAPTYKGKKMRHSGNDSLATPVELGLEAAAPPMNKIVIAS